MYHRQHHQTNNNSDSTTIIHITKIQTPQPESISHKFKLNQEKIALPQETSALPPDASRIPSKWRRSPRSSPRSRGMVGRAPVVPVPPLLALAKMAGDERGKPRRSFTPKSSDQQMTGAFFLHTHLHNSINKHIHNSIISNIKYSKHQHQASSIKHQASSIKYQASSIKYQTG